MPLLPLDLDANCRPAAAQLAAIEAALVQLPPGAPVVLLLHGFRYAPGHPLADPHRHILGAGQGETAAAGRSLSWPLGLGFAGEDSAPGLAIAVGWQARGAFWNVWRRAARAGEAMGRVIAQLSERVPGQRFDIMAHSLGARVALSALPRAPSGSVARVILLAAAEFDAAARLCLRQGAGPAAQVINVLSRENAVFDRLLEIFLCFRPGRSLGRGLRPAPGARQGGWQGDWYGDWYGGWTDLPLDDPRFLSALAAEGIRIAGPGRRICHWSSYLRDGALPFYRLLLRDPDWRDLRRLHALLPAGQGNVIPAPVRRAEGEVLFPAEQASALAAC